jgi:two-component system, cell cycle sensor histidine kinase and response regulator CckA
MSENGVPASRAAGSELESLRRRVEELEQQLAQSQKLHAIGSLAGGVAHDFNNLLTAIVGYVSLLREDAAGLQNLAEALDVIEKAADRASQLTAQLLGFARVGQPKRVRVDLHHTLPEVTELLRHTIDKKIRLETRFEAAAPQIMGDPGQMFQILP